MIIPPDYQTYLGIQAFAGIVVGTTALVYAILAVGCVFSPLPLGVKWSSIGVFGLAMLDNCLFATVVLSGEADYGLFEFVWLSAITAKALFLYVFFAASARWWLRTPPGNRFTRSVNERLERGE